MSVRRAKALIVIFAFVALGVALSGCVAVKPGSYSLSQPTGIGPVALKATLCTAPFTLAEKAEELPPLSCGPVNEGEAGTAQLLLGLLVPAGTATPESVTTVSGPGAAPMTFTRSAEVTARMAETELKSGQVGAPAGFEIFGYISGVIAESAAQELDWSIETTLGAPLAADGGSSGAPLPVSLIIGWRNVTPEQPATRPVECALEGGKEGEGTNVTVCGTIEPAGEATLGVSDLKVQPPAETAAVPGQKVKLPFLLDFASSAAPPPSFALTVGTGLPGAGLSLSNATFERPTDPTTHRAPPTTRKAIVQVPASARLGSYEVSLAATAAQGGVVSSSAVLRIAPKGSAKVKVPKKVKARIAYRRGIPVNLYAPIAATRFQLLLKGPRPHGRGRVKLRKQVVKARRVGSSKLRLRLPRRRVEALLATGKPLRLEAKARVPGTGKPQRIVRTLKLR